MANGKILLETGDMRWASGGGEKAVLQASDFTYLGMFSVSDGEQPSGIRWGLESGGFRGRWVGGQVRLLCYSGENPPPAYNGIPHIYEISPPATFGSSRVNATWATWIRDWGAVKAPVYSDVNGVWFRGIGWDPALNGLWIAYAPRYSQSWHDPGISYMVLNDETNVASTYGPWRTQAFCKYSGGYMCQIPEDFANTYCNGHRMALGSSTLSRNGTSAWGPIFLPAARLADYLTRDPDEVTETEGGALNGPTGAHPRWSIATRDGMLYTADHNYVRAGLADEVIHCGWGAGGHGTGTVDCGAPYTEEHGAHTSALSAWDYTAGKTIATMDWWASSVWIDTGTKHGVVYFATFVKDTGLHGTPAHLWYGSETCPHGYFDKRHTGVGDGASCKTSLLQIYDPLDIAASLNEEVTPYSVQPTVEATIYPTFINDVNFQDAAQDDLIMGAWYDEVDHRLYLRERMGDTRAAGSDNEDRSMIHVFQVE